MNANPENRYMGKSVDKRMIVLYLEHYCKLLYVCSIWYQLIFYYLQASFSFSYLNPFSCSLRWSRHVLSWRICSMSGHQTGFLQHRRSLQTAGAGLQWQVSTSWIQPLLGMSFILLLWLYIYLNNFKGWSVIVQNLLMFCLFLFQNLHHTWLQSNLYQSKDTFFI